MRGRFTLVALPPQITYQGPLTRGPSTCNPHLPRGAPHGRPRGPSVWPPATRQRHLRPARATRAPATWPQRHIVTGVVDPRATSARRLGPAATSAPLATSAAGKFSLFRDFHLKKRLKNSIKNQIKIGKNSIKIHNLKYTTPF